MSCSSDQRLLLSGDEAIALAAFNGGVKLGAGYPGTPSTEILEYLAELGGLAQWSPNEKVALEVALGAAFCGARAIATMKHVGLNVAADPLFTAAYTGVSGGLIVVSADDPGMHSSQNEQDNRHYAVAAAVPMLEPSDSQEAYDFTLRAFEISERWGLPVLLRATTRVCHSRTIVVPHLAPARRRAPAHPLGRRQTRDELVMPGGRQEGAGRESTDLHGPRHSGDLQRWLEAGLAGRQTRRRPAGIECQTETRRRDHRPLESGLRLFAGAAQRSKAHSPHGPGRRRLFLRVHRRRPGLAGGLLAKIGL